tara:strand:- start:69 stop:665 length:597 start_codon:yes stop_codon:yes gene_type:complete
MALIAQQNIESPIFSESKLSDKITERRYQSSAEDQINNFLISIEGGGHNWSFNGYNTSEEVLKFFNQSSTYPLPETSSLYTLSAGNYHVRTLGEQSDKGDVVILSGANKFFHSDSAWTSLIQPLLAEHARVHVIDRLGNAWSSTIEEPSFAQLATDLHELLTLLGSNKVTFLSFANSNLATLMYLSNPNPNVAVKGVG